MFSHLRLCRKKIEAELLIEEDTWKTDKRKGNKALDIYNSAEEIKDTFIKTPTTNDRKKIEHPDNNREVLQELKFNKKVCVY